MRKHVLLFVCFHVFIVFSSAFEGGTKTEKVEVKPWMYKNIFAVSEKGILARALEKEDVGKRAIRTLMDYYTFMELNITALPSSSTRYEDLDDGNMPMFLERRGWPTMNETQPEGAYLPRSRPTQNHSAARAEKARFAAQERQFHASEILVFDALVNLGRAQDTPRVTTAVRDLANWTHVFHNRRKNYTTKDKTHNCIIRANIAYRINGRWCVGATVTNDRPDAFRAERERKFLTEYLRFDGAGTLVAQPLWFDMNIMPEWTRKYWGERPYVRNSTERPDARTRVETQMSEWGGQAGIFFFLDRPIEENIALVAALESSTFLTRQALDSRTFSNSAILILPLFMSLLPIALFADVSDAVLLGYLVFTDFLAVLPLGIKGVELVVAGLRKYFSTRTKLWGDPWSANTLIAVTYSCKCQSAYNLAALGSAFIAIAAAALIVGVALEFIAKSKVEQYKMHAAMVSELTMNDCEYLWERTCNECECDARAQAARELSVGGGLIGQMQARRREGSRNVDLENLIGVKSRPPG